MRKVKKIKPAARKKKKSMSTYGKERAARDQRPHISLANGIRTMLSSMGIDDATFKTMALAAIAGAGGEDVKNIASAATRKQEANRHKSAENA